MTKYANTPAGRAAAAADMAATGTTMGRRPTGPKGPMVRPGVRGGPRSQPIYNRRKSGTPVYGAGPRGPLRGYSPVVDVQDPRMGPRGPKTGANPVYDPPRPMGPRGPKTGANPVYDPPRPMGPRGPKRGYGPNDGPVTGGIPAGMTKDEYLGTFTDRKPFDTEGKPSPMGPRITPVNVTGMPVGGPKTGIRPADGKPNTLGPRGPMPSTNVSYMPPRGPMGPLPGTVGGAPTSQQVATQSAIGTPYNKPSFFKKGGAVKSKAMRGGGLARKGVGMALAKGGLARRAGGCAKRGVGKGRMV